MVIASYFFHRQKKGESMKALRYLTVTSCGLFVNRAYGQDVPVPADAPPVGEAESPEIFSIISDFLSGIVDSIGSEIFYPALATLLSSVLVALYQENRKKNLLKRVFSDVPLRENEKKCSVMLIGVGGTGKSTLAEQLCGQFSPSGHTETKEASIWQATSIFNGIKHIFFISDYRGQDFGTLVSEFIQQQSEPFTPFRYGYVNSLILVVDIVAPKDGEENLGPDQLPKVRAAEVDRVNEHITQWNETALDAVFGMHTIGALNYVCLFINKIDRLSDQSDDTINRILEMFEPLRTELDKRCHKYNQELNDNIRYAKFDCYLGSAHTGSRVSAVSSELRKISVPLDSDMKRQLGKNGEPA